MLVTSCPECDTTFRVTEEILDQADGQVRCGRCSRVFNGILSLCEQADAETYPVEALESGESEYDGGSTNWFLTDVAPEVEDEVPYEADAERAEADAAPAAEPPAARQPAGGSEAAAAAENAGHTGVTAPGPATGDAATEEAEWLPLLDEQRPRRNALWIFGATVLALLLAGQFIHAFRTDLVAWPVIGGPLTRLYSRLGIEVTAVIDLKQYELLDLASVTDQATAEQGWLMIEARLKNNGPKVQPYPQIFVALQDRWQETVAGRYFEPEEYSAASYADYSTMSAGGIVDAQFIIVDPGPDVTGFELQICKHVEQNYICDGDEVFN